MLDTATTPLIKPKLGDVLLGDLEQQPELIERAQAAWLSEKRRDGRKGCLTPGYVKSVRTTLTTILRRAKRRRKIKVDPTEFVDQVRVERTEMRSLEPVAVQDYLKAFDQTDLGRCDRHGNRQRMQARRAAGITLE